MLCTLLTKLWGLALWLRCCGISFFQVVGLLRSYISESCSSKYIQVEACFKNAAWSGARRQSSSGAAAGSALSCPLLSLEQPLELPPLLLLTGDSGMATASSFDPLHVLLSRYFILKHSGVSGESRGETVFRGGIPPVTLIQ